MTTTTERTSKRREPAPPPDQEQAERRIGLLRLVVGVLLLLGIAGVFGILGAVLVIFAVLLMIVLHELGHFATAKWTGMKVTEFFVGFGPRLWSVRRGETEYGVKALPLGGYCKIPGMTQLEEIDPADEARTYRQQRFWKRLLVATAGSATHFILAFLLLLTGLLTSLYIPLDDELIPVVASLGDLGGEASPAQRAGFQVGDRIVAVDGDLVQGWDEVRSYTSARPGERIDYLVEREGRRLTLTAVPVDARGVVVDGEPAAPVDGEAVGLVGISADFPSYGVLASVPKAGQELGSLTKQTFGALGNLVTLGGLKSYGEQLAGRESRPDDVRFLSPVGLANVAGSAAESGLHTVLFLLILINIFVGMFNMVPLLPLDGGHVVIAAYEAIRARPGKRYFADVSKLQPVLVVTLILLAFLALSSLYLDLRNPLPF